MEKDLTRTLIVESMGWHSASEICSSKNSLTPEVFRNVRGEHDGMGNLK